MEYVRLDDVYKAFNRRYGAPTLRLHQGAKRRVSDVDPALRGVTLRVDDGEAVAVLGTRRSGRSTLVSVIAGLYRPDAGTVRVHGRVSGLTSMGAGFSAQLPLRNCVDLNASIIGMSKEQLDASMDDILAFSGLREGDMRHPMREIAGTQRRQLGYALAVYSKPDVFLADGLVVLSRADLTERCFGMLENLRDDGTSMVLATNKKSVVTRLATRAVVLSAGEVAFDGPVRPALRALRTLRGG